VLDAYWIAPPDDRIYRRGDIIKLSSGYVKVVGCSTTRLSVRPLMLPERVALWLIDKLTKRS